MLLDLTAVSDNDRLGGSAVSGADSLNSLDDLVALDDLTEDNVLAVQPGGLGGADEELGAGAVRMLGAGHGDHAADVRLGVELGRHEDTTHRFGVLFGCDVAHVAEDLADRAMVSLSCLQFDDDDRSVWITRGDIDPARSHRPL